ncbi:hypothetical protein R1flu_016343 [Riccia fluitans]|uniref:Glycosyltransferase n=1 Tax=Riccia fluitans TaxID=41844 RepID=A0ABD1YQG3_9MARC
MGSLGKSPRALVVPMQTEGHWSPCMSIIRCLVDHKIDITLCVCQDRADEMKKYADNGDLAGVDVEVVVVFSHCMSYPLTPDYTVVMEHELKAKMSEMRPERFSCVISDMLMSYCEEVADELDIPYYGLTTTASHYALALVQADSLADGGWFDNNPETDERFLDAPGLEVFTMRDLNWPAEWKEMLRPASNRAKRTTGLLINTFDELEQNSLDVFSSLLQKRCPTGKVPCKIFTIGPLLLFPTLPSFETHVHEAAKQYVEWLDQKPKSSVVFICFGTNAEVVQSTGLAMAKALESTHVSFLWALRLPPGFKKEDILPEGFEARTQERGLVVATWVSQQDVLVHPSTAAFISHCGWNSTLESIIAGVPIITHPLWADQHMNARHLVSRLKVAVEIKHETKHERGEYTWEAITEAIKTLMIDEEGQQIRGNMKKLQQAALKAAAEGGSSHRSFQELGNEIKRPRTLCSY